jgi:AcrR family transcriptional regulator
MPTAVRASEPSRSDAVRNRELIVEAARSLFASVGAEASVREIARAAGVGIATVYRNFPSREDLVDAVLEDAFDELLAVANAALEEPDPWHGFTSFIENALVLHSGNRGLKDIVETQAHGRKRATTLRRRIRGLVAQLVERAQQEGRLRSDFRAQDVTLLFWACDRAIELGGTVAPEIWRRQLGFLLDGLRCTAATPLAQPPLTDAQLRRIGIEAAS